MPKVFTIVPGAVIQIGQYGFARNDEGAEVPEKVARQLDGRADLNIVRLPPAVIGWEPQAPRHGRRR